MVTWFGEGYNLAGDPAGALVLHMVGQVRDQRLIAYQLLLIIIIIIIYEWDSQAQILKLLCNALGPICAV